MFDCIAHFLNAVVGSISAHIKNGKLVKSVTGATVVLVKNGRMVPSVTMYSRPYISFVYLNYTRIVYSVCTVFITGKSYLSSFSMFLFLITMFTLINHTVC